MIENSISYFFNPGPSSDLELERQYRSKNDPEKPPKAGPGDKYIVIGAIVGMIAGGIVGTIVGSYFKFFLPGIIAGVFAGGIIGATIGDLIKKRRQKPGSEL